ncbi:isoaspartyl peptidase/L-asparaginase family protein [Aurantibacillus circumpalustris]|uniref:isoaspartyl peptidase/L-asparaginase family protein n=1 Tax=Aurantibacillus circumpalustris TaxID=3036359 RepID=UPI00295AA5D4|nr:isoaspartyl peptidase/L-asparaginase [Aurantibacillus circumpalustris]
MNKFAIAIHGGAGTILRSSMTPEKEIAYQEGLKSAIFSGEAILKKGGASFEAVETAIRTLEDNPLFNAGKGAVFTHNGKHEMDASIMNGLDLSAGAVAGVQNIKNPISLARSVMEQSEHVLLAGSGAIEFAKKTNAVFMPDDYFFVQLRYDQLQQALKSDSIVMDHTLPDDKKFGTVGAVALDVHGNLAAGTSTGGMTNKKHGRVGDTPIIGAGTYANNKTCAISCTGHGEFFIRSVVAYDISCLIEYKGLSLKEACELVVKKKLVEIGGEGGLIALDTKGNIEFPFNSEGMYRASLKEGEKPFIGIYND